VLRVPQPLLSPVLLSPLDIASAQLSGAGGGGGGYVGPLDIVAGPVIAFGQRAMSAVMRGQSLYTVREGANDATQAFNSDATTGEAPVAAIMAYLNGASGTVIQWDDQSGNSHHVIAPETVQNPAPTWMADVPTSASRPGFSFSNGEPTYSAGSSLFTAAPVTINATGFTLFAVVKTTFIDPGFQLNSAGQLCGIDYNSDNTLIFDVGSGPNGLDGKVDSYDVTNDAEIGGHLTTVAGFADAVHVVEIVVAFGTHYAAIDNIEVTANNDYDYNEGQFGTINGVFVVGGKDDSIPGFLNCPLLELLLYPSVLSSGVRASLRENIAGYYGVTLS
jgi:hypothetical protein